MNVKALAIFLGGTDAAHRIGVLFQYHLAHDAVTTRFVADEGFATDPAALLLSSSLRAANPEAQRTLWADVTSRLLNGRFSNRNGWLLPAFFQNLLPEGVFRDHIAELRACDPKDHFEMLAACGKDLPGFVYALPVDLDRDALSRYITQNQDALEMSVTAEPLEEGVSLSGVQPKVSEAISTRVGVPIIPYVKGYAIGNVMSFRVADGNVYTLNLPTPDYEISVDFTGLKKVKYGEVPAGVSFIYGSYATVKIEEPLLGTVYLNTALKNGEVKVVPMTQTYVDDFPAFYDSLNGLFVKLAEAVAGKGNTWVKSASAAPDIESQILKTRELMKLCK